LSVWRLSDGRWRCAECRRATTATAGTILADTRLPLRTWFRAAWYLTNQKQGVSALGLQRALGLGSYETAWAMLHKFRRAMVRPGRELLDGTIEVDETYVGGAVPGKRGRGALGKTIVAIAVEARGVGESRSGSRWAVSDLLASPTCRRPTLTQFVQDFCTPGSVIYTDHWVGYNGLTTEGFKHHATNISASGDPAHVAMRRVHRIASLLKRWLLGTHQGGIGVRQADFYLDEFVFRFNRRRSKHVGLLFYRLLEQAVASGHTPVSAIVGGRP
jgi:transposase-like protein